MSESQTPLTPAMFHVLLALADGEKHGYAIMLEVEHNTQGAVKMGPGTLYGSIKRMIDLVKQRKLTVRTLPQTSQMLSRPPQIPIQTNQPNVRFAHS